MTSAQDIEWALEDESGTAAFELATGWITSCVAGTFTDHHLIGQLLEALNERYEDIEFDWDGFVYFCQFNLNSTDSLGEAKAGACQDSRLLEVLGEFALSSGDPNLEVMVSANPHTPVSLLRKLAESENGWEEQETAEVVARNPSTSPETLAYLAEKGSGSAKYGVASNPTCPADKLTMLLDDDDESFIRSYVLRDGRFEDSVHVNVAAAANPSTPAEALGRKLREVMGLVQVPDVRQEDLQLLAALVTNSSAPLDAVTSVGPFAERIYEMAIDMPYEYDRRAPTGFLHAYAVSRGASPELLHKLVSYSDAQVRVGVAGNPSTEADDLRILAQDPDIDVRSAVHRNAGASDEARAQAALMGIKAEETT
jgi:hypothetical protein